MTSVMLKLGPVKFSMPGLSYDKFKHSWKFTWPDQARLNGGPGMHYTGPGAETIALNGEIYPGKHGMTVKTISNIADEAAKGQPLRLVSGTGENLGYWAVTDVNETGSIFMDNGAPRKITFSLTMKFYAMKYPA